MSLVLSSESCSHLSRSLTLEQVVESERQTASLLSGGGGIRKVKDASVAKIHPYGESQRRYYESEELIEKIDIGLVWWPNRTGECTRQNEQEQKEKIGGGAVRWG